MAAQGPDRGPNFMHPLPTTRDSPVEGAERILEPARYTAVDAIQENNPDALRLALATGLLTPLDPEYEDLQAGNPYSHNLVAVLDYMGYDLFDSNKEETPMILAILKGRLDLVDIMLDEFQMPWPICISEYASSNNDLDAFTYIIQRHNNLDDLDFEQDMDNFQRAGNQAGINLALDAIRATDGRDIKGD